MAPTSMAMLCGSQRLRRHFGKSLRMSSSLKLTGSAHECGSVSDLRLGNNASRGPTTTSLAKAVSKRSEQVSRALPRSPRSIPGMNRVFREPLKVTRKSKDLRWRRSPTMRGNVSGFETCREHTPPCFNRLLSRASPAIHKATMSSTANSEREPPQGAK